jgi:hypothetical protein|nr:MAG TPA: hypothetical protein [Caudoviricetes sp.]
MAQQTLNNGIAGSVFRKILNDNFTELYTDKATKNHASSTTYFGVATTSMFGHVKVTTGNGLKLTNGVLSLEAATTTEATNGISTSVVMTPARVKEAVNAYGVISDGNTIIKVGGTQPSKQTGKTIIWINTAS